MVKIGYHISHEQFSPASLLQYVVKAEEAGFQFALSSDHFYPWSDVQGHSGYAWSWLGAALARTSIPMGIVNCPYRRYNPAISWHLSSGKPISSAVTCWPSSVLLSNLSKPLSMFRPMIWRAMSLWGKTRDISLKK